MARASSNRKKKEEHKPSHDRWLVTYADLITLLMIFFVLMYTMSQIDVQKYSSIANSLSMVLTGEALAVLENQGPSIVDGLSGEKLPEGPDSYPDNEAQIEEVKHLINDFINRQDLGTTGTGTQSTSGKKLSEHIVVYEQERGLVISFKDTLLFASGSADLTPEAREIIKQVGASLVDLPNYIRVEGHTDNLPINTPRFPSNWELSVLRASNVVHVLSEEAGISPERLSIIGYGEYRPLVPNDSDINRAMNRRVDIVILKQKYDYFEPPVLEEEAQEGSEA